eukprot:scaffold62148_cov62-Attheya_sp.AAC.2
MRHQQSTRRYPGQRAVASLEWELVHFCDTHRLIQAISDLIKDLMTRIQYHDLGKDNIYSRKEGYSASN